MKTELPDNELSFESEAAEQDQSIDQLLAYLWWLIQQYYWVLLPISLLSLGGAYFWTQQQPRIFRASSKIVVYPDQSNILGKNIDPTGFMGSGKRFQFERFWNTQKEVLTSRPFLEKAMSRMGLSENPDFQKAIETDEDSDPQLEDRGIEYLLERLSVTRRPNSRVGIISVESPDAELSATIANGISEEYLEYVTNMQTGDLREVVHWFDEYVSEKGEELTKAQRKLQRFKQKHNILSLSYEDRQNLTAENRKSVNKELNKIRRTLSKKEALLEQIQDVRTTDASPAAIAGILKEESLDEAIARRNELQRQLATLRVEYLSKHPEVRKTQKQLTAIKENIEQDIESSIQTLKNRVQTLKKSERNLERRLATLNQDIFQLNELGVEYNQLKNKAENLEKMYESVLTRSSELNLSALHTEKNVEILEEATVPQNPVSPSLPLNLAFGLFVGLGLGGLSTLLLDSLDKTIKNVDELTYYTDEPLLGLLPSVGHRSSSTDTSPASKDLITHTHPRNAFSEAIKTVRTNLTFADRDKPSKTLLVTSPGMAEGKTLVSINLGISTAQSGEKTLIIESDLRRPRIHKALNLDPEHGIEDVLRGDLSVEEARCTTPIENLYILPCPNPPDHPAELLHSSDFRNLINSAEQSYDRVILDSPPTTSVSDALIMSRCVDGVIILTRFEKTDRNALAHTIDQFQAIDAPVIGYIANEVDSNISGYGYYYDYS
jgi:capsular exopolysaccharide synthesis family protein